MKIDVKMILGTNIRKFREDRDIQQQELADSIGISKQQMSLIETGVTKNPGIHTVKKVAQILEVTIDDLFLGDEPKTDTHTLLRLERLNNADRKVINMMIDSFLEKDK